jgi:hypothetical protein
VAVYVFSRLVTFVTFLLATYNLTFKLFYSFYIIFAPFWLIMPGRGRGRKSARVVRHEIRQVTQGTSTPENEIPPTNEIIPPINEITAQ